MLAPLALADAVEQLRAGTSDPVEQDESLMTYAPKLLRAHGVIDWNMPAIQVARKIRAYHSWPGTFTTYPSVKSGGDKQLKIFPPIDCFPRLKKPVEAVPGMGSKEATHYFNILKESAESAAASAAEAKQAASSFEAVAIIGDEEGEMVTLSDASELPLVGLKIFGKTTQDGTPTPGAPIEMVSAGDGGSITVFVTDGTEENKQTVVVQPPNGICGLPVSSGGNYTDVNGQQWLCDEIDLAKGVHIHQVHLWKPTEDAKIEALSVLGNYTRTAINIKAYYPYRGSCDLCTHLQMEQDYYSDNAHFYCADGYLYLFLPVSCGTKKEEVKAWLIENNLSVLYELKEPYETELDAVYTAPHTNKLNTTIYNDAGTGMKVSYVADTKAYIDNKFSELAAAIVNNT
jgi:hypothetical protein